MKPYKHKRSKFKYYVRSAMNHFIPSLMVSSARKKLLLKLTTEDRSYIDSRVAYYIKKKTPFKLSDHAVSIKELGPRKVGSAYYYDMLEVGRFFPKEKFDYLFGDITHIPETPSFLKSRPITSNNENSVLLKLNKVRHFNFICDENDYDSKKDVIIWRGTSKASHHRFEVCGKYFNAPNCDIALCKPAKRTGETHLSRQHMTIEEQLQYKFILSMEGNDVATNLKWIMSSNSLCFMRKPRYETWFMEGTLIPDYHYVLLKDDFSDLLEKVHYYINNPDQAKVIIQNANQYVEQFLDQEREELISLLVMEKYLELSQGTP